MTDRDIIQGLLSRDNNITRQFFFIKCRPLFLSIISNVFNYSVEYEELIGELYSYLMENDGEKLRQFQFRSSIYQWMKVVATRFFITLRNKKRDLCTGSSQNDLTVSEEAMDSLNSINDKIDIENLLKIMDNQRYAEALRKLVLEDMEPECYARQIGTSVDNLYNIKKRAMTSFSRLAIKYYGYGS